MAAAAAFRAGDECGNGLSSPASPGQPSPAVRPDERRLQPASGFTVWAGFPPSATSFFAATNESLHSRLRPSADIFIPCQIFVTAPVRGTSLASSNQPSIATTALLASIPYRSGAPVPTA